MKGDNEDMIKTFKMKDLDCANCAAKMEGAINKIKGVNEATVSYLTQKLTLDYSEENFEEIKTEITKCVKKIEPDCVVEF